ARHQLLRVLHRLGRLALVVALEDVELLAEHAAPGVDLVDGELDTVPVRPGERRTDAAERVDLADANRRLGGAEGGGAEDDDGGERNKGTASTTAWTHDGLLQLRTRRARRRWHRDGARRRG